METRRLLVAIGLSILVLVAWQYLFVPAPEPIEAPAAVDPPATSTATPAPIETAPGQAEAPPADSTSASTAAPPERPTEAAEQEQRVRLETARAAIELTNRGAQLISYELKEHPSASGGRVDLVRARMAPPYPFALRTGGDDGSPLNDALFVVERGSADGGEAVEFRYSGARGAARKRFVFRQDGTFDVEVQVDGGGEILLGPAIRNPADAELENRFTRRNAIYRSGEELERVDPQKLDDPRLVDGAGLKWFGIQDTYFLTALVPASPVEQIALEPVVAVRHPDGLFSFSDSGAVEAVDESGEELPTEKELRIAIGLAGDRFEGTAYWGAKNLERLERLPYGLDDAVNLGFFGILARPLLWGLLWIHDNVVSNYGWAIILMTILIRLVLFPLTHKSFVSMQKMQKLNPRMQAIRQKYRPKLKDKQGRPNAEMQRKMNEEIMGLYKKEGVNPAGGCLPMLLQIPVLFAFYTLLSTAVELRYAPWIFWIQDLSAKDPLYVLPIVMGGTQFLQQRLTPSSADPMQRRIFMLMPVFFTVLFLGFPSGLVLYWLTNNVLGIIQQYTYKRLDEKRDGEGGPAAKKRAKGKG